MSLQWSAKGADKHVFQQGLNRGGNLSQFENIHCIGRPSFSSLKKFIENGGRDKNGANS